MIERTSAEVAVVGGGPAGLTAAIALADARVQTVLISGGIPQDGDNRTTALLAHSVKALEAIGAWERCRGHAAPLRTLRIVDDTDRLWRAPEVRFDAAEIGLEAFGWNIENRHLLAALRERAGELSDLRTVEDAASAIATSEGGANVVLASGGTVRASLVIGADGRRSLCRAAAGIATEGWQYPQTALTYNLGHSRQHSDSSTEFHTPHGPFTLVPLPGLRSSLVCVVTSSEADRLAALDADALNAEIERRAHSILGRVSVEEGHGAFPLAVEIARRLAANRIALVGEAAHVIPPLGAQGLNLGLRDAAVISDLAVEAHRAGEDVGVAAVTDRYNRLRRGDVTSRTIAVDLLNRSLLSDFLPVQGARGFGLYLLERIAPLRRALMREGVAPDSFRPRLMRGEPL